MLSVEVEEVVMAWNQGVEEEAFCEKRKRQS